MGRQASHAHGKGQLRCLLPSTASSSLQRKLLRGEAGPSGPEGARGADRCSQQALPRHRASRSGLWPGLPKAAWSRCSCGVWARGSEEAPSAQLLAQLQGECPLALLPQGHCPEPPSNQEPGSSTFRLRK